MKSSAKGGKQSGKQPGKQSGQKQQSQQPSASGRQQQQSGEGKEYGEGSYKGTRLYNQGLKDHIEHHDIEKEARDAAPKSVDEEREMEEAERIGRSRARGSKSAPDDPEDEQDLTSGSGD